jgi:transcriptional regulator with XRE-family HTH domain
MVIKMGREPDPAKRIRQRQGGLIKQVRTMRQMSVRELADAINNLNVRGVSVTPGAVSHWENGIASPRQVTQLAIAQVLDVPWSTIFSLDGETLT